MSEPIRKIPAHIKFEDIDLLKFIVGFGTDIKNLYGKYDTNRDDKISLQEAEAFYTKRLEDSATRIRHMDAALFQTRDRVLAGQIQQGLFMENELYKEQYAILSYIRENPHLLKTLPDIQNNFRKAAVEGDTDKSGVLSVQEQEAMFIKIMDIISVIDVPMDYRPKPPVVQKEKGAESQEKK